MTDTDNPWPLPKFHFSAAIEGLGDMSFTEVSGLDTEKQAIEYREGNPEQFAHLNMPGITKYSNVTLKRGIAKSDTLFAWMNQNELNPIKPVTVKITLMDEQSTPVAMWTLTNAFPVKMMSADLKSGSEEVAIETIELAYEGLTVSTPDAK